jgi:hypothetical protein
MCFEFSSSHHSSTATPHIVTHPHTSVDALDVPEHRNPLTRRPNTGTSVTTGITVSWPQAGVDCGRATLTGTSGGCCADRRPVRDRAPPQRPRAAVSARPGSARLQRRRPLFEELVRIDTPTVELTGTRHFCGANGAIISMDREPNEHDRPHLTEITRVEAWGQ